MPPANLQTTKLTPTYREVVSLSFGVQLKKTVIDWSLSVGSGHDKWCLLTKTGAHVNDIDVPDK